ncbi:4-carboxymuconolactone decarboxylase [Pelagovum pacificum]|uniref:4-carboxymuconolactone decarboxylase n=1 Tax=Pelagovum pacificum TaxID=2588711 RepID=A0A5C5GF76_9RHOB|nr:4-carboxymuconolactone decarboxylase [Pelagovum pacificum]QQA43480.1 4-carboxymuconolactone decarboxylase [Pelagovum pacificum]TNY33383.1 4-carboxymuconolactone decarboxylase [Pelagovum pacificum]
MSERFDEGMKVRREVLGDEWVDKASAGGIDAFQQLITESAWGTVWASDGLARRDRSLVTLALLAGLGNWEELRLHLHACRNTGATREEVLEVFQHVAIYAGVPRANHARKIAKDVWAGQDD